MTHYTAPGFEAEKAKFTKPKIRIVREYYRDLATCQACHTCPNYHREIFVEIRLADLAQAQKIGYTKAGPAPEAAAQRASAEHQPFPPKPDAPPEE